MFICNFWAFVYLIFADNFRMKRISSALILCVVVIGVMFCFVPQPFSKVIMQFPQSGEVNIYCQKTCCTATNMGNGFLVECSVNNFTQIFSKCENVDGISVRFPCENFSKILQKLHLQSMRSHSLDGVWVVCGYTSQIRGGIVIDGQKVNVQVAYDGQTVTIGSPLILDSF